MRGNVAKIFNIPNTYAPASPPDDHPFVRVANIYKTNNGSGVRNVNYDYTYYPIPRESFVVQDGITQKTFPQTHWYVPNASNISYRKVCMDLVTTPYQCG